MKHLSVPGFDAAQRGVAAGAQRTDLEDAGLQQLAVRRRVEDAVGAVERAVQRLQLCARLREKSRLRQPFLSSHPHYTSPVKPRSAGRTYYARPSRFSSRFFCVCSAGARQN
jgi:hypothetical protein